MQKKKIFKGSAVNLAVRVSAVSIAVNIILSLIKLAAGILGKSDAMVSDAVHSVSDILSTLIVIAGIKLSAKEADKCHPYGHERFECVASIILAVILGILGAGTGAAGIGKILSQNYHTPETPGIISLIAAVISIAVKEWMFWYTRAAAKKLDSGALMADAWHHRSDALSSVGSFAGVLFARIGFRVMDSAAGVIISLCIIKAAYDIFKDGINKMVDHSCDCKTQEDIFDLAFNVQGVVSVDALKTRLFGSGLYVDIEISAEADLSLRDAYGIGEQVRGVIEEKCPKCIKCMVYVKPAE